MRIIRSMGSLVHVAVIAMLMATLGLGTFTMPASAAVVSERVVMDGEWSSYTGGMSRTIVAAPSPGEGIVVWDRSSDSTVVIPVQPGTGSAECVVGGDLVVWDELLDAIEDPGYSSVVRCYNARTSQTTTVAAFPGGTGGLATDGRFVVYDRDVAGDSRCWDSLTGTTRTIPTVGGLWHPDMQDGVLVWVDDVRSIAEGSELDTGFIRAWDAVTGRLTPVTTKRAAVVQPKTDGHQVAWNQGGTSAGTTHLWDPSLGARTVPGMSGTLRFDHGVLIGLQVDRYIVREPSGSVRVVVGNNPNPDQADYSDGLLSGRFANQAQPPVLRSIDVYTSATNTLMSETTGETFVQSAADLLVSNARRPGPITVAQVRRPVRVEGRNRFDVSVQTAEATYPRWAGVKHVIIASGDDRASADPLAAAGLSWRYDAPLMLVSSRQAPVSVVAAVKEIVQNNGPVTVHVVGGTSSVPDAVVARVTSGAGAGNVTVDRVAAPDRYTLAATIARRVAQGHDGGLPAALIANGSDASKFFDAAALSAIAAEKGYPILLVERDRVPAATASFLGTADPNDVVVAGGRATVSDGVVQRLGAERWAGADRYATAAAIATKASDPSRAWLRPEVVGIASVLPDALSGGVLTGRHGGPLLLTAPTGLSAATSAWLTGHAGEIERCWILGGSDSLSSKALSQASAAAFD